MSDSFDFLPEDERDAEHRPADGALPVEEHPLDDAQAAGAAAPDATWAAATPATTAPAPDLAVEPQPSPAPRDEGFAATPPYGADATPYAAGATPYAAGATPYGADATPPYGAGAPGGAWAFATPPPGTPPPSSGYAYAPPPPPRRAHGVLFGVAAALLVVALAAGGVGYLLGRPTSARIAFNPFGISGSSGSTGNGFHFTFPSTPGSTSSTVPKAVATSEKALVDVDTTIEDGQASGAGTGIVLTSSGLVLTNNHVIDGATSVSVTDLGNGQTYGAKVVGYSMKDDVALLQLTDASGLTTATIGAPATVGEQSYAVGNAGGGGGTPTVTSGQVTGTDQTVTASDNFDGTSETLHGMLQTSAALISGDSGGALTSSTGTVLGVDTAGSGASGGGYAIPIATALSLVQQIEAGVTNDTVHVGPTALLGVEIRSSSATTGGAPVSYVVSGTPAASAGITSGSHVTSIGGLTVTDGATLRAAMTTLSPGSTVSVTWVDASGTTHTAKVVLTSGAPQ